MKMRWMGRIVLAGAVIVAGGCKSSTGPDNPDTGVELTGTITGSASAGVTVYLSDGESKTTTTDSTGKFSFKGLTPGKSYFVTPSRPNTGFSPSRYECSGTRKDLNFTAGAPSLGTTVDKIAADFVLKDQNGATVTLSQYHGKVVLLDFTADWCTVCRDHAQTADAYYRSVKDRGFMYILVVIEGSPANWASSYGLSFPVLDDNAQVVFAQYRTSGSLPLPHVLDRNMTIRYKAEAGNVEEYKALIQKLL